MLITHLANNLQVGGGNSSSVGSFVKVNQDAIDNISDYIANLIQQSEKSRKIMKNNEVHLHMLNIANEALLYTDVENKV